MPNIHILRALTAASYGILITQHPKAFIQQPLLGLFTSLVWRGIKRESKALDPKLDLLTHKLHFFCLLCDYKILKYFIRREKTSVYSVPSKNMREDMKSWNWTRHHIYPRDFSIKETISVMIKRSVLPHYAYCVL